MMNMNKVYLKTTQATYFDLGGGILDVKYRSPRVSYRSIAHIANTPVGLETLKNLKKQWAGECRVVYRCPSIGIYPYGYGQCQKENALVIDLRRK